MYSSLQKLDMVVDDPERGPMAVQTDHRTPDEIDAEWDLSLVFLAVRARAALLCGQVKAVRFAFLHPPPERMVRFARSCGAEVEAGMGSPVLAPDPDLAGATLLVEEAFLRLGAEAFREHRLSADLVGLEALEERLAGATPSGPEDEGELPYWTNVARLGGAAALVAKAMFGGALHADDELAGPIPFRWSQGGALTNLFGRAATFLDDDPGVAPSKLVALVGGQQEPDGDIMFHLRPPGWEGLELALTVPLLPNAERLGAHALPVVAIVVDLPTATKTIGKDTAPEEVEELRARALENNRKHPVEIQRIATDGTPILVVHGHYYAAERLLDPAFVSELGRGLGAELLLAAVPKKGLLIVQDAATDPDRIAAFTNAVRGQYDHAQPAERLSPEILLVQVSDGAIVGLSRLRESPGQLPPPRKKGLWARWFGSGEA